MTIRRAISEAKRDGTWRPYRKPVSVLVIFKNTYGEQDETELDLYCADKIEELAELWDTLCREMDSAPHLVIAVEQHDKIM